MYYHTTNAFKYGSWIITVAIEKKSRYSSQFPYIVPALNIVTDVPPK